MKQFSLHDPISEVVYICIVVCWLGFFLGFRWVGAQSPKTPDKRRDRVSLLGTVFQGAGFAGVWILQRRLFAPIVPMPEWLEAIVAVLTVALAVGSEWLVFAAVRTLGRQWAYTARLVEHHQLIVQGPYRWVRNPIYSGMFGMMIATGLAASQWIAFPIVIPLFALGTWIRVRSEERLLRDEFGKQWEEYRKRVAAVLPGIY